MEDRCVCCGEIVPEGRQVCWMCEAKLLFGEMKYIDLDEAEIYAESLFKTARPTGRRLIIKGDNQ